MPQFRVSISKTNPPAIQGVYDFAQTVVAPDQQTAIQRAYESWDAANKPALNSCYVSVTQN